MQDRSLLDLWLVLYSRRYNIAAVVAFSVITSYIGSITVPPVYEARSTFFIPAELPEITYLAQATPDSLASSFGAPISISDLYAPYLGMLKSVTLAKTVQAQFPSKPLVKLLRADVDFELSDDNIVAIYVRDRAPEQAAAIANAYVDAMRRLLGESLLSAGARQTELLHEELLATQKELGKAVSLLRQLELTHRTIDLDSDLETLTEARAAIRANLDETLVQVSANANKLDSVQQYLDREGANLKGNELALTTPVIDRLRIELVDVSARLAELSTELGPNNIEILALESARADLDLKLANAVKNWLKSTIKPQDAQHEVLRRRLIDVTVEQQRLAAMADAYKQTLMQVNERLGRYPEIKAEISQKQQEVEQLRELVQRLTISYREAQLQFNQVRDGQLVALDSADPPGRPAFPILWLNILVALVVGTIVGVLYAFLLDYIGNTRRVRLKRLLDAIEGN